MSKKLVAYFSASGVTAEVAKSMAETLCCDICEIKPAVLYTQADLDWMDKSSRSSVEMQDKSSRPEIVDYPANLDGYDTIYLGFPVWWYVAPTIVNTFVEKYDLTGKTVVLFATSGGSDWGKTVEFLENSCKGAKIVEGKVLRPGVSRDEFDLWVKSL
ncbi:MAG: flavodoxin [Oscillospiraceae bacterium]|nr:flavodoxin [Oscillospiraceae bacterium]